MPSKHAAAILLALCSLIINQHATADVTTWLNKVTEAYGGTKTILATRAYRQYGVTFSSMRGSKGKVLRAYRYPDHLRIEIDYVTGSTELRLLAGPYSWKQNQPMGEPFYSAMLLQVTRLGLPAALLEHQRHVKDGGVYQSKQGKALHALELNFHTNNQVVVGIDPETGRIIESRSIINSDGFQMEFATHYDDFRMVADRLFAFHEIHYAMGRKTGYTRLERIVIEPLADELFYPAGSKPQVPRTLTYIELQ